MNRNEATNPDDTEVPRNYSMRNLGTNEELRDRALSNRVTPERNNTPGESLCAGITLAV